MESSYTDFSKAENRIDLDSHNDVNNRGNIDGKCVSREKKDNTNDSNCERLKEETMQSEKLNFVIIDSREGLGLKQDYYDANKSSTNDDFKNSDNINKECSTNGNTYNDNNGDNNNNYHLHDIENNNNSDIINKNKIYQNDSNNNKNIDNNDIGNINYKISEISSYALFTDFKNIINRSIRDENRNNLIKNYQPVTYSNNKNVTLFYLKEKTSFKSSNLNSNNCLSISLNIHKNDLFKIKTDISNIYNLSPYSEAKKILFTDIRFFQDWVRKKDFSSC